jgi:hypothetical protein
MRSHHLRAAGGGSSGYSIVSGNKAPTANRLGNSNTSNATYNYYTGQYDGWTNVLNSSQDDHTTQFTWQNSLIFYIAGTQYSSVYIGSNSYATFGGGSTQYSGLSASSPSFPKIFVGGADNSYQRLYHIQNTSGGQNYYRIRYEGNNSTSGVTGSPGIVWEITFFDSQLFNGNQLIELLVGIHGRPTQGQNYLADSSTALANMGSLQDNSFVFEGNSTGTSWTTHTSHHVGGTDY